MDSMKKLVAGGVVLTLAGVLAVWAASTTRAGAQGLDVMTLVGPGSSIGVTVREVTQEEADKAKLAQPVGVVIESVRPGSPAEKAGFRTGDIVLDFNGERVLSVRQFTRVVRESAPRRQVEAVVVRGTSRQTLQVVPEVTGEIAAAPLLRDFSREFRRELPRSVPRDFNFDFGPEAFRFREIAPGPALGVSVLPLGSQLAEYFGVKNGALVTEVQSGTPAADAGLKAGDVITAINGRVVTNAGEVRSELRGAEPGAGVDIAVTRDRKSLMLKATLPPRARPSGRGGVAI
jgi:serine protease Do